MNKELNAGTTADSSTTAQITTSSQPCTKPNVVGSAKDELGLYDSANGKSIKAYKIVDATELTNNSKRCVIKYALSVRGVIAQICDWYKPDVDLGVSVHYFIDEMSPKELSEDEVFERRCRVMDAHALTLSHFIYDNR